MYRKISPMRQLSHSVSDLAANLIHQCDQSGAADNIEFQLPLLYFASLRKRLSLKVNLDLLQFPGARNIRRVVMFWATAVPEYFSPIAKHELSNEDVTRIIRACFALREHHLAMRHVLFENAKENKIKQTKPNLFMRVSMIDCKRLPSFPEYIGKVNGSSSMRLEEPRDIGAVKSVVCESEKLLGLQDFKNLDNELFSNIQISKVGVQGLIDDILFWFYGGCRSNALEKVSNCRSSSNDRLQELATEKRSYGNSARDANDGGIGGF